MWPLNEYGTNYHALQSDYLTVEHNTGIDLQEEFVLIGQDIQVDGEWAINYTVHPVKQDAHFNKKKNVVVHRIDHNIFVASTEFSRPFDYRCVNGDTRNYPMVGGVWNNIYKNNQKVIGCCSLQKILIVLDRGVIMALLTIAYMSDSIIEIDAAHLCLWKSSSILV